MNSPHRRASRSGSRTSGGARGGRHSIGQAFRARFGFTTSAIRVRRCSLVQGAHPKAIQQYLGHNTISVTLDRYGHLFPDEQDRVADALDTVMRGAGPRVE